MDNIYLICAIVGAILIVCQFLMSLLGLGHHDADVGGHELGHIDHVDHGHVDHGTGHDIDGDSPSWFVGILSFRTIVAAVTFFGLAGRAGVARGLDPTMIFAIASAAGCGAGLLVAYVMRTLHSLKSDGTVRIERAVGKPGVVYLRIPPQKAGCGKISMNLQNRLVEYQAVTAEGELPTGAQVVVVGIVGADTVEVALQESGDREQGSGIGSQESGAGNQGQANASC